MSVAGPAAGPAAGQPALALGPIDGPVQEHVPLDPGRPLVIGRSERCDLTLPSRNVSREHATIHFEGERWYVTDRHSRHGTYLNGNPIEPARPEPLDPGAELWIRPWSLRMVCEGDGGPGAAGLDDGKDDQLDVTVASVDLAQIDTVELLQAVLDLPRRLTATNTENEAFETACRYLGGSLRAVLRWAAVVIAPGEAQEPPEVLAEYARAGEAGSGGRPALEVHLSRRVIRQLCEEKKAVVFMRRNRDGESVGATLPAQMHAVGASLIEFTADGRPIVLYALGDQPFVESERWVAECIGVVSTLVRQHILVLRRAHLAKYMSAPVVNLMMKRGGHERLEGIPRVSQATSLFFDLRGFSFATELPAQELLKSHADLQGIMGTVTEEVFATGGTVIDFSGDGLFAAWGVPFEQSDQCDRAVRCAMQVFERLHGADLALLEESRRAGGAVCGIGIACGEVLAGPMGTANQQKYGILGPSVNVASRLELLTKPNRLDAPLIVTARVRDRLDQVDPVMRRVGRVKIAGMKRIFELHEVVMERRMGGTGAGPDEIAQWNALLEQLEATRDMETLDRLEHGIAGRPDDDALVRWARPIVRNLRSRHVEAWDGVIRYTTK